MDPFSLLSVGFAVGAVVTAVLFIWWSGEPSNDGEEPFTVEHIEAAKDYDGGLILTDDAER